MIMNDGSAIASIIKLSGKLISEIWAMSPLGVIIMFLAFIFFLSILWITIVEVFKTVRDFWHSLSEDSPEDADL